VRDKESGKLGSASQIIEVPDLTKRKQPGDYVLQLSVFDRAGKQTATPILPFVIMK